MPGNQPILTPAGFAPATAVGFANANGEMVLISAENPLPIAASTTTANVNPPLEGQTDTDAIVGPFAPTTDRPVVIQLSGTWAGSVQLLRSTDNGATKFPVTLAGESWGNFTANVLEPVWQESEAGAELYLDIALTSGTVAFRVSQ